MVLKSANGCMIKDGPSTLERKLDSVEHSLTDQQEQNIGKMVAWMAWWACCTLSKAKRWYVMVVVDNGRGSARSEEKPVEAAEDVASWTEEQEL